MAPRKPNRVASIATGEPPKLPRGSMLIDVGSTGLRAYSGYVREEILTQLLGREAQRAYREMLDNSSVVGSIMFAITQAMRRVTWRVEPVNDSSKAKEMADKHNDGYIGWRRLPGRGQDTIIKWFFDEAGSATGVTQQPYIGPLIDMPIEKFLLFRTSSVKNSPEGRSILRNAYRAYFFIKRLEEQEAISVERLNGYPVVSIPSELIDRALSTANGLPADPQASAAYAYYKKLATNIRVDEQMGAVLPSDVWKAEDGKPSQARMFELRFLTPEHAVAKSDTDKIITRYKVDILMTVLADFIQMGHEVRGTNNLAVTKVDMFYQAIEGWLNNHAAVLNRYALPRLWKLNGFDLNLMPEFKPDMAQRLDLDSLGAYVANMAAAGMPLFPDEDLQTFLREAGGMPEDTDPAAMKAAADVLRASLQPKGAASATGGGKKAAKPKTEKV
jgi:hypothetical protein